MLGQHKLFQRYNLFCQFPRSGSALSTKTPMEGLKFLFRATSQDVARTPNISRCRQIVSREESGIKLSSGCGWFFFMPSYPNKESEPQARSASAYPRWNWRVGTNRAVPDWTSATMPGANCSRSPSRVCVFTALSSLPTLAPSPSSQIHLYCCLEGAQVTQIGSAVIGFTYLCLFGLCVWSLW